MPQPPRPSHSRPSAFTLLELMAVITIIAILAVLLFPTLASLRTRPEAIRCMANMRSLHSALGAYLTDNGHWPQEPENLSPDQSDQWWLDEMERYAGGPDVWKCPSLSRGIEQGTFDKEEVPLLHYLPSRFDENQFTPYRWSTQPWLIERFDHGDGSFLIFPDGHIETFNEVYRRLSGEEI